MDHRDPPFGSTFFMTNKVPELSETTLMLSVTKRFSRTILLAGVAIFLIPASAASAVDNEYVTIDGGSWADASHWSLGHCPWNSEDVKIEVSGSDHKAVTYDWTGTTGFPSVTVDGDNGYYGAVWHLSNALNTDDLRLGWHGLAYWWMEGPAHLWLHDHLYVGFYHPGEGRFHLETSGTGSGVEVDGYCYVGYNGTGTFDHLSGEVQTEQLYVGQNAAGTYNMTGSNAELSVTYNTVIGNADVGLFEQTSGTVNAHNMILGLNSGGDGTYLMKGGTLNANHLTISWAGDGYFTQSGGTTNLTGDLRIGYDRESPHQAWFKLTDDYDDPIVSIDGDMIIGENALAKYEQLGAGTVTVDGTIEIWRGTTTPGSTSYLYMGTGADWLGAGAVINHDGYYDQDGGTLSTSSFTNDSTQGINLDNNADCRVRNLTNNAGTIYLYRNALLRGPHAFGQIWWTCEFTNEAEFVMGGSTAPGGEFRGILTNNGTFEYNQGTFSGGVLINNGTFDCNNPFSCYRFVQNSYSHEITEACPLTVDGDNYTNAIENNANFTIRNGASVTITSDKPFVNNGNIFAGGTIADDTTIFGNVVNNNYLLPAYPVTQTGTLRIEGDYSQTETGSLRIRLGGMASVTEHDQLRIVGNADLNGVLDVRLHNGYEPEAGDAFSVLICTSRTGKFSIHSLPVLPPNLEWNVLYRSSDVLLNVSIKEIDGDCDADGDVDLDDYHEFFACMTGPDAQASHACECFDLDYDDDVDMDDFVVLSANFTDY